MSTKKKAAQDVNPLEWLLEGEEVDDAERAVIEQVLARESVAKRVKDGVLGRSEFSRRMDELAEREKELQKEEEDLNAWRNDLMVWKQAKESEFSQRKPADSTDDLDDDDLDDEDDDMPKGKYLTEEQVEKILQDRLTKLQQGMQSGFSGVVGLQKFFRKAGDQYYKEFGDFLDPDEFEKFYVENKHTDYNRAFEEYVAPKREENRKTKYEEELKAAREEGRREAMSGHDIPGGDITSANRAPLLRKANDKPMSEDEKVDRFATLLAGEQVEAT